MSGSHSPQNHIQVRGASLGPSYQGDQECVSKLHLLPCDSVSGFFRVGEHKAVVSFGFFSAREVARRHHSPISPFPS